MMTTFKRRWPWLIGFFVVAALIASLLAPIRKDKVPPKGAPSRSFVGQVASSGNQGFIGLPWSFESFSRMQATDHSDVDYLFTAIETGGLAAVAPYIVGPHNNVGGYAPCPARIDEDFCYSAGNGGTIRLDIYADNNAASHLPSGPSLGSFTWVHPMVNGSFYQTAADPGGGSANSPCPGCAVVNDGVNVRNFLGSWFGHFPLTPQPSLTKGTRYHAVWTNPDAAAATNWYGLDFSGSREIVDDIRGRPFMSVLSSDDWDAKFRGRASSSGLHNTGNVWRSCSNDINCWASGDNTRNTPIVSYKMSSGTTFGNGYGEDAQLGAGAYGPVSNGFTRSRQSFTIAASTVVDQIGVRIIPVEAGTARFKIVSQSSGTVLRTVDMPYTMPALPRGCVPGVSGYCLNNGVTLVSDIAPLTMPAGNYYIDFDRTSGIYSPQAFEPYFGGGEYPVWGPGTRWEDGQLEGWNGSVWTGSNVSADAFTYLRIQGSGGPATTTIPGATTTTIAATTTTTIPGPVTTTTIPGGSLNPAAVCSPGGRIEAETWAKVGAPGTSGAGYERQTAVNSAYYWRPTAVASGAATVNFRVFNDTGATATRTVYFSPMPSYSPLSTVALTVPSGAGWQTVTVSIGDVVAGQQYEISPSWETNVGTLSFDYADMCGAPFAAVTPPSTTTTTTTPGGVCLPAGRIPVSTVTGTGNTAALVDLDEASVWTAAANTPQTVILDLGQLRTVRKMWVKFKAGRGPSTWTVDVKGTAGGYVGRRTRTAFRTDSTDRCYTLAPIGYINVRYVRMILQTSEPAGLALSPQLYEVGVY